MRIAEKELLDPAYNRANCCINRETGSMYCEAVGSWRTTTRARIGGGRVTRAEPTRRRTWLVVVWADCASYINAPLHATTLGVVSTPPQYSFP